MFQRKAEKSFLETFFDAEMEIQMKYIHGGDIYRYKNVLDFSANINPLPAPENVVSAIRDSISRLSHYPDYACTELRGSLAEKHRCERENIICGNGAADLLFQLAAALRPRCALVTAPSFQEYQQALRVFSAEIRYHVLRREENFALTERYLEELTGEIDAVFLCSPNNPTGNLIASDLLWKIAERCQRYGILMVVDECFLDFVREGESLSLTRRDFWKEWGKSLLVLRSFTKMFSLAGLRLGYAVSGNTELLEKMRECRQPWSVSTPAQMAGVAAAGQEEFIHRTVGLIEQERRDLQEGLGRLGFSTYPSQANFLFFEGPADLWKRLLEQGILIRDCRNFRGLKEGDYRVAVRTRQENEKLLDGIRKA